MRRIIASMLAWTALLAVGGSPASAALDNGACLLEVDIAFPHGKMGGITSASNSPNYTVTVRGATDLDPATSGVQACYYPGGLLAPFRATDVLTFPNTTGDLMSCEAFLSSGGWDQEFIPSPPTPIQDGTYHLTGTWGAWVMHIESFNSESALHLRFATTSNVPTYSSCTSNGVSQLSLLGVLFFQDP